MYFRLSVLVLLNVLSVVLTARNLHQLPKITDSPNNERVIFKQDTGAVGLVWQECRGKNDVTKISGTIATTDLRPVSEGEMIQHNYYTLSYSEENEQAIWVYYKLTDEMLRGTTPRTDDFRADKLVSTLSAHPDDYAGCGYDRGHLCPSADMTVNHNAMSESFYMSNMSPQVPAFNRGIWKKLEATVRNWAVVEQEIYVVTGPVFKDNLGVLSNCNVTVPGYYYKIVFDSTDELKMIGLILPNGRGEKQLSEYVVTVNDIETLTGINFFEALPDTLEDRLESRSDASLWDFSEFNRSAPEADISVQCKGVTKSTGKSCRNKTTNPNGYCHHHQSQVAGNLKK